MNAKDGSTAGRPLRQGFTLLELMVAMAILVIAMAITFQAFSGTVRGWKRGMEVADGIKHGEFAMGHLAAALNSTIYFFNPRKTYAFKHEKGGRGGLPADEISFVTASGSFMPPGSPFAKGPHRLKLHIGDDERGNPALFALASPAIADDDGNEDTYDAEPILVSRSVQGMEIQFWNPETEDWTPDWEEENAVPGRLLLTLFVASDDEDEEPIEFSRVLEIPVSRSVELKLAGPSGSGKRQDAAAPGRGGGKVIVAPGRK